jgi:hypothetical protein
MSEELTFRIVFWLLLFILYIFNRVVPALRAKQSGQTQLTSHLNSCLLSRGKGVIVEYYIGRILYTARAGSPVVFRAERKIV